MNKGSIVERLCSDLDRKEPRYKSPTLLYFTFPRTRPHKAFHPVRLSVSSSVRRVPTNYWKSESIETSNLMEISAHK